ncbi:phosphotransferase [Nocardia aurea]|uniref:phosphotransferase n=1 Tax=Nocardia aurea TaxID=2144174 RepID=UPI0033A042C6
MTSAAIPIPSAIAEVDAPWLTAVLRDDDTVPATALVATARAEQIAVDTGFSSILYRVHLTGTDVPSSVVVKLPATSQARGAMDMLGGYARELAFYRHVAGRAPISAPHAYLARIDADSNDFVLVLEDLARWDNADQLAGLSLRRTRRCLAELAGLHAWSTDPANAEVLELFPSIDTPMTREILPSAFSAGWQIYRDKTRQPIPVAVAEFAERFPEHAPLALRTLAERTMLVHGDIRADNMFFDGDDLEIIDFQLTARGAGAADIAYLISQGLPTAQRTGRDEELLREYLDLLAARGVHDYPFDLAWRDYRFAAAYMIVLPVVILIGWDSLPQRSRDLCVTLADRAVATIDEIHATEVFS